MEKLAIKWGTHIILLKCMDKIKNNNFFSDIIKKRCLINLLNFHVGCIFPN